MRKKEPLLPVLILGLLAFTVLWPLWFTVGGALMASDELTKSYFLPLTPSFLFGNSSLKLMYLPPVSFRITAAS